MAKAWGDVAQNPPRSQLGFVRRNSHLTQLAKGRFFGTMLLDNHATLTKGKFAPHLVSAPPLFMAIWLKNLQDGADYIYPYYPLRSNLVSDKIYSMDDFLAKLIPLIQQRQLKRQTDAA